jgi:hypothetical protein
MIVHSPLNFENSPTAAPARELAKRRSGTDEILLLWHPEDDRVEVTVRDLETCVGFQLDVEPAKAIDAFTHPYAYVATREIFDCVIGELAAPVDG